MLSWNKERTQTLQIRKCRNISAKRILFSAYVILNLIVWTHVGEVAGSSDGGKSDLDPGNSELKRYWNSSSLSISEPGLAGQPRVKREKSDHSHTSYVKADCGFTCDDGTCISAHKVVAIAKVCDNYINCKFGEDEKNCKCEDKVGLKKHCDSFQDCPSGSDENCGDCSQDEFSCFDSEEMVSEGKAAACKKAESQCNGILDCESGGLDESSCFRLQTFDKNIRGLLGEGFLQKRIGPKWFTVCKGVTPEHLAHRYAFKVCEAVVGEIHVDDSPKVSKIVWPATNVPDHLKNESFALLGDTEAKFSVLKGECPSGTVIKVVCPEPKCGWPVSKYDTKKPLAGRRHKREVYEESESPLTPKIVGGYDSEHGEWPFLVGFYRNGSFHCGGSIVHKQWIVTAAHCFHGHEKYVYEVQAGMMRRFSWSPLEQTRQVHAIYTHEKYDPKIFLNDIALVKLDSELYLSKWVAPACLSPRDKSLDPKPKQHCSVIGWGDISESVRGPDHMQEVELPVREKCQETFTKDAVQICAGVMEGGKDACQGDSGGPFVCQDDYGRRIVCGIVSFGRGCARPNQPGVYTKVSAYIHWIDSVVSGENHLVRKQKPPLHCGTQRCLRSGGECLFPKMMCDRKVDCFDAMDESNCRYEGAFEDDYGIDERAYSEVETAAHVTVEHVHDFGKAKLCGPTEFQCKSTKSCLPTEKVCSGTADCFDRSDEKNCDCGTIITNIYPAKSCDGILDCLDGSDEADCEYRNGIPDEVKCPFSEKFINSDKWCDGNMDCSESEDEIDCVRLVRSKDKAIPDGFLSDKLSRGLQSGYVFLRSAGTTWRAACRGELGEAPEDMVCKYLGYSVPGGAPTLAWTRNPRALYVPRALPVAMGRANDYDLEVETNEGPKTNCTSVRVTCGEANCGERRLYSYSRGLPQIGALGAMPWFMIVMVEGNPVCPATLVHKQWVVVPTACIVHYIRSLTHEYVSVMSGFTEKTRIISSPLEQVKRVNGIEKDSGSMIFLHLESPVLADHFAAPICTKFGVWHNSSVEVEPEVLRRAECIRAYFEDDQIYQVKVHIDPLNSIKGRFFSVRMNHGECETTAHSFVYCTLDGTGWFFLGFIGRSEIVDCERNGFVELQNPLYGVLENRTHDMLASPPATTSRPPTCTGVRCSLGNCVNKEQVCDKVRDCSDNSDESRCQRHYLGFKSIADEDELNAYPIANATDNSKDPTCPLHKFRCKSSGKCIPLGFYCNRTGYEFVLESSPKLSADYAVPLPLGHFRCKSTGNFIPISAYCDGIYDCGEDDFSDEPLDEADCTCRHYLELSAPEKVCDSVVECPDKGDELLCPCRNNHSFYCNGPDSNECILPEMVCDGEKDCKSGQDEAICISMSTSAFIMEASSSVNELEGYVMVRLRGSWHPYCSNDWSGEMGLNICLHLGFPQMRALETIDLTDYKERVRAEDGQNDRTEYDTAQLLVKEDMDDSEGKVLYLDLSDDREESEWLSCRIGHLKCVLNNGKG